MALPEASVSNMKGREKVGMAKTRVLVIATLSHSKTLCAFGVQLKLFLHRSEVKGAAMAA